MKTRIEELFELKGRKLQSLLLKLSDGGELLYMTNDFMVVELEEKENGDLIIYKDKELGEIRSVDKEGYLTPTVIMVIDDSYMKFDRDENAKPLRHEDEPNVIDWEGIDEDGNEI